MSSKNSVKIPILDFAFVNSETGKRFSLTDMNKSRNSKLPPWSTSFTYSRRANAMGAGTWTLAVVDPTFTFLDVLNRIYTGGEVTEADILDPNFLNSSFTTDTASSENLLGEVEFSYGYRDDYGNTVLHGPIHGWISKISPSIQSKFKLNVNFTGIDMNPIGVYNSFEVKPEYFINTTLDASLTAFFDDNQSSVGLYTIEYEDENLKNIIVNDVGISQDEDASFLSGFLTASGSLTLSGYLNYLQNLLVYKGIRISISRNRVQPEVPTGSVLSSIGVNNYINSSFTQQVIRVFQKNESVATFYVNTQDEDFLETKGSQNYVTGIGDSRVISFDPTIEPLMPSLLGARNISGTTMDQKTLEAEDFSSDAEDSETIELVGDKLKVFDTGGSITRWASMMPKEYAMQRMKFLQGWLCQLPLKASLRCQYVKDWVNPYNYIRVYVTTPQGQLFFTSGVYLVTEVTDQITPGRYLTTYQMIKSGTQAMGNLVPNFGKINHDHAESK